MKLWLEQQGHRNKNSQGATQPFVHEIKWNRMITEEKQHLNHIAILQCGLTTQTCTMLGWLRFNHMRVVTFLISRLPSSSTNFSNTL